ncbi:hypothetical protein [Micromonospora sp. WMMD1082]|uniref:hypothetical protein n=1 Tax=Micromonospora sp. WMMD1082 TaxID=3016104 RepID=UPI0024175308|nr:hypothetical protein [Micromonospora sp. WMMD1082]MDG4795037.1 hypothetical protein [Micromonospora sp. WMMD1082]
MLTDMQQQAIVRCLTFLDEGAHSVYCEPAPNLVAVLIERPLPGHPTARHLVPYPAPVPPKVWDDPDGPVAALRKVSNALHDPVIQAIFATVTGDVRALAWVFLHTDTIIDDELGPQQVRYIDAVDIDDRTYVLTRLPEEPAGVVTVYASGASDASGAVEILRSLARILRTQ